MGYQLLLALYREIWVWDFEFIAKDGEHPWVVCMVAWELRSGRKIHPWHTELTSTPPFDMGPDVLFVSFAATAELSCHLVLGWPRPANVLDLYVEQRWLTNGRAAPGISLLTTLAKYGLKGITKEDKKYWRDKIKYGGPWSWEEQQGIMAYCETDCQALADLLPKMVRFIDWDRALLRGHYMFAVAWMEHVGVPFDLEVWEDLIYHWPSIKGTLIADIDSAYGVFDNGHFSTRRFLEYIAQEDIGWPALPTGTPELTQEVWEERSLRYPQLGRLAYLMGVLDCMKLAGFLVGHDGFNRAWLRPFWTVTGRNQPSPAEFIFGASAWIRGLVKPPPDYGIAYIDWVQQEFGIAAALSGDPNMLEAYRSGDSYIWWAEQVGAVPKGTTKVRDAKKLYPVIRKQFKECMLGTNYEMGEKTLSSRIGQPLRVAANLLRLHRETFPVYWEWIDRAKNQAFIECEQATVFGWRREITETACNPRSIGNLYSQGNGAEMLRLAAIFAADLRLLVCSPVHDAFLIMAPLGRLEADIALMRECMERASELVLNGFRLRTDVAEFRYPDRYKDDDNETAIEMWNKIMKLLGRPPHA